MSLGFPIENDAALHVVGPTLPTLSYHGLIGSWRIHSEFPDLRSITASRIHRNNLGVQSRGHRRF